LRKDVTHSPRSRRVFLCSITGAPKFRAMEIIDELNPFHGALLRRDRLLASIAKASEHCHPHGGLPDGVTHFNVGAASCDSDPAAEYEEHWRRRAVSAALKLNGRRNFRPARASIMHFTRPGRFRIFFAAKTCANERFVIFCSRIAAFGK